MYGDDGISFMILKTSDLQSDYWPFRHCFPTSTFPSNSLTIVIRLWPIFSKNFESFLKKILKQLYSFIISDGEFNFHKERFTDNIHSLPSDSWFSVFRCFNESFALKLDISKTLKEVFLKPLIFKLLFLGISPSLWFPL